MTSSELEVVVTCIAHGTAIPDDATTSIVVKFQEVLEQNNASFELLSRQRLGQRAVDVYGKIDGVSDLCRVKSLVQEDVIEQFDEVDVIIQLNTVERKDKRLVVFDMDSTLIYQEVIELIAQYADVGDKVRQITQMAMNGEIDFKESLQRRVKLLKGIPIAKLYDEIKAKLQITKGVPELCSFLQTTNGTKLCVLSGGFIQFAEYIKDQLHFDFAKANLLEVDDEGKLTGGTVGEVVDGQCKADTLLQLCAKHNIDVAKSCMIGDGGNDLLAMAAAGLGIAWNAKPRVQRQAPCKINTASMLDVLYIFGYSDSEIAASTNI